MQDRERARRGPTVAQLKADIDSGRTGDKVDHADPGLSPLGTDDEAAGTPATPDRIATAVRYETRERWAGSASDRSGSRRRAIGLALVIGVIVLLAVAFTAPVWIRWI